MNRILEKLPPHMRSSEVVVALTNVLVEELDALKPKKKVIKKVSKKTTKRAKK